MTPSLFFPPAERAARRGLVLMGGELSPEWLIDAYRHGIFPWPSDEHRLSWWSPDPRAIFEFDNFHVSRSLARTCRRGAFSVTFDRDFASVIEGCASTGERAGGTWITTGIKRAYRQLHDLNLAHSVEAWQDGILVGGVYGVAIGALFAAESMFHRQRDASKVALAHLVAHLRQRGYQLLDIQQLTPHTGRLGATEIPRSEFLLRVAEAVDRPVTFSSP